MFYKDFESLTLENCYSVNLIKITDSLIYLKYIKNYNNEYLSIYGINDKGIFENSTFEFTNSRKEILNYYNNNLLLLKSYNYKNFNYIFQFEVSQIINGNINSEMFSMSLDSAFYDKLRYTGDFQIVKLNEFNYRIIFFQNKYILNFNSQNSSYTYYEIQTDLNYDSQNDLKKINNKYYYTFNNPYNINTRVNIYDYVDNKLVHSIVVPQNVSINYPKQEYLQNNKIKDVTIFDNKLFVTIENIVVKGNSSLVDRYLYNSYILMDTILFDLSEDITSIENEVVANSEILIFPNPSSDKISLNLGGVQVADLVIYDILGNEIMSIPNYTNKSEVDISNLSIGTYTIQVQTSTGNVSQRLMVNR